MKIKMDKKKEILEKLGELCENHPEQRFGQILYNYTMIGTQDIAGYVKDPFFYSDDDFLEEIKW